MRTWSFDENTYELHRGCKFTLTDGTSVTPDEQDFYNNGISVDDAVTDGETFAPGGAVINQLSINLMDESGKYSKYNFEDATVEAWVSKTDASGTTTTLPIFYGTVVDAPIKASAVCTLTAYDVLYAFDTPFVMPSASVTNLQNLAYYCVENCLESRSALSNGSFAGYTQEITSWSGFDMDGLTYRQVMAWIAQATGNWVRATTDGKIKFETFADRGTASIGENDVFSLTPNIEPVTITGIRVTEYQPDTDPNTDTEDGESESTTESATAQTVLNGNEGYVIEISDNPIIAIGKGNAYATLIGTTQKWIGLTFTPFEASFFPHFEAEAGDKITFTDYKGNAYTSYITSVKSSASGEQSMQCSAESAPRNKSTQYSVAVAIAKKAQEAVRKEKTSRELAIESLQKQITSGGVYTTVETDSSGGKIYYLHNQPKLSDSSICWKMTANAMAVANSKDSNGDWVWNAGITVDGDAITRILTTTGINASWIKGETVSGSDLYTQLESAWNADISDSTSQLSSDLQSQIDGKIETWYQSTDPSNNWTTAQKTAHTGDLWYDTKNNVMKRYTGSSWVESDAKEYLLDQIDGKRQVFTSTPTVPYDKGDLWAQGSNGDLYVCQTAKTASQSYSASDWVKATKYTDDSAIQQLTLSVSGAKISLKSGSTSLSSADIEQSVIDIIGDSINLDGYVKFTDLSNDSGSTTISGSLITTGKIQSADGKTYWDLANSKFVCTSGQFSGDISGSTGEFGKDYYMRIAAPELSFGYRTTTGTTTTYIRAVQLRFYNVSSTTVYDESGTSISLSSGGLTLESTVTPSDGEENMFTVRLALRVFNVASFGNSADFYGRATFYRRIYAPSGISNDADGTGFKITSAGNADFYGNVYANTFRSYKTTYNNTTTYYPTTIINSSSVPKKIYLPWTINSSTGAVTRWSEDTYVVNGFICTKG